MAFKYWLPIWPKAAEEEMGSFAGSAGSGRPARRSADGEHRHAGANSVGSGKKISQPALQAGRKITLLPRRYEVARYELATCMENVKSLSVKD